LGDLIDSQWLDGKKLCEWLDEQNIYPSWQSAQRRMYDWRKGVRAHVDAVDKLLCHPSIERALGEIPEDVYLPANLKVRGGKRLALNDTQLHAFARGVARGIAVKTLASNFAVSEHTAAAIRRELLDGEGFYGQHPASLVARGEAHRA
jgi:hypothetical protein